MKLPRDISGAELTRKLSIYGYHITRQSGSHIRLTTEHGGKHHLTIPAYRTIPVDILDSILGDLAQHLKSDKSLIVDELFRKV